MADVMRLEPAPGLRLRWDDRDPGPGDDAQAEPRWALEGSLGPGHAQLRVLVATFGDGGALFAAAVRPDGAPGHDRERFVGALVEPDGARKELGEILLSSEYAADGSLRRLGMELYEEGEDYPLRAAADARSATRAERDGLMLERTILAIRLDGREGTALHEAARGPG